MLNATNTEANVARVQFVFMVDLFGVKRAPKLYHPGSQRSTRARFSYRCQLGSQTQSFPRRRESIAAMDGHQIHMQLKLFDRNKLTLVNRGFHWINDYPFQR